MFDAEEMSELNPATQVPEELIAGPQGADGVESGSWEIGSTPSLPSIDRQDGDVSYTSLWNYLKLTVVLGSRGTPILLLVPSLMRSSPAFDYLA